MPEIIVEDSGPAAEADGAEIKRLARALAQFEAEVTESQPTRVILADSSDDALAALLVATKLLIPVAATDAARDPSTANGRVIAQLAETYTR